MERDPNKGGVPNQMTACFVILHHQVAGREHWDLMLEHGGVLLTWQLEREPVLHADLPMPARRIGDHRLAYLEYEGPVSRDRGTVTRVDRGPVRITEITASKCEFEAGGTILRGRFCLIGDGDDWRLEVADGGAPPATAT